MKNDKEREIKVVCIENRGGWSDATKGNINGGR